MEQVISQRCDVGLFEYACKDVKEHAARTGCEKAILLAGSEIVLARDGDRDMVSFDDPQGLDALRSVEGVGVLVHSHPEFDPLSEGDITMAWKYGHEVWAIANDGGRYATTGWKRRKLSEGMREELDRLQAVAREGISRLLVNSANPVEFYFGIGVVACNAHLKNCAMAKVGLMDYRFTVGKVLGKLLEESYVPLGMFY